MPTDIAVTDHSPTVDCTSTDDARFYVSNCGYDTAGKVLDHLLTNIPTNPITSLEAMDTDWANNGILRKFSQREFLDDQVVFEHSGFDKYGYVYYPNNCINGGCKVHALFHGTSMGHQLIGDGFIKRAGYLEYASSNDLILLMPQMKKWFTNPFGTWDTNVPYGWQYTRVKYGPDAEPETPLFNTNEGVQPKAVMAMIDRLTNPLDSDLDYT